ncbi:MAG TPA: sensor histidine kinase [Pseudogracilibacillus sp.]|nr:sensor histidine kinase [Pseudogracilibacillus sp.]
MHRWYSIFPKYPWLSIYTWVILCLLPFFFIFKSSSPFEIAVGIILLMLFFICYRFSFKSKSGLVYMWLSFEIIINAVMTLLFGFVYFALFTAFFIGNIRSTTGFFIMYGLHIASTIGVLIAGFFLNIELFLPQLHFIIISLIGTVLLPFHLFYQNRRKNLEGQLEVANEKISELIIYKERQRIARDLHDTLGHKLSLIGLKSDLAGKLVTLDPTSAEQELTDIRNTASAALKEVRELVSDMRSTNVKRELLRVKQILTAAEIELIIHGNPDFANESPLIENVLGMCMKEAVTNVVKHSYAKMCEITFLHKDDSFEIEVKDDGIGIPGKVNQLPGSGLIGMQERLEFVNGNLFVTRHHGTSLTISVPAVIKQVMREE